MAMQSCLIIQRQPTASRPPPTTRAIVTTWDGRSLSETSEKHETSFLVFFYVFFYILALALNYPCPPLPLLPFPRSCTRTVLPFPRRCNSRYKLSELAPACIYTWAVRPPSRIRPLKNVCLSPLRISITIIRTNTTRHTTLTVVRFLTAKIPPS